ncbi:MAG: hypothetical protein A3C07_02725 [Candidatus Sungbacteria bacterium RIFCSPHIGHO2_02_FULL_47_11]|uniref:Uncharacterized protein n=1 Tax=Candidatus Sungbacteria bacterium RIFCSPHIGHO2_02_FULL_47_11 TaxID=1802270 RepID=A0A1G2KKS4_9BACT|nr:MAG: hypothetical protein A3C07_02725 [Candidatus Sungbacteria bacterium RIFCSPHIGHO2_02_FULL_47_11]
MNQDVGEVFGGLFLMMLFFAVFGLVDASFQKDADQKRNDEARLVVEQRLAERFFGKVESSIPAFENGELRYVVFVAGVGHKAMSAEDIPHKLSGGEILRLRWKADPICFGGYYYFYCNLAHGVSPREVVFESRL